MIWKTSLDERRPCYDYGWITPDFFSSPMALAIKTLRPANTADRSKGKELFSVKGKRKRK
jgi:hypothetical protein